MTLQLVPFQNVLTQRMVSGEEDNSLEAIPERDPVTTPISGPAGERNNPEEQQHQLIILTEGGVTTPTGTPSNFWGLLTRHIQSSLDIFVNTASPVKLEFNLNIHGFNCFLYRY